MANSSIQELLGVLQKSGLPFDNSTNMETAGITARDAIAGAMPADYSPVEPLRQNYRSQLDQVAAMDQKLAGIYGDPSSNLFIENPLRRQSAISGASTTGYKAASGIASTGIKLRKEIESQNEKDVSSALSLYKSLTNLQSKEEARIKKAEKAGKVRGTSVNTSLKQIKKGRYDLAGLSDPDAIAVFERAPANFQAQWVREYQAGLASGDVSPDENFYTAEDLKGAWSVWDEKTKKPKTENKKKVRF